MWNLVSFGLQSRFVSLDDFAQTTQAVKGFQENVSRIKAMGCNHISSRETFFTHPLPLDYRRPESKSAAAAGIECNFAPYRWLTCLFFPLCYSFQIESQPRPIEFVGNRCGVASFQRKFTPPPPGPESFAINQVLPSCGR
jgi:hypothetical protein